MRITARIFHHKIRVFLVQSYILRYYATTAYFPQGSSVLRELRCIFLKIRVSFLVHKVRYYNTTQPQPTFHKFCKVKYCGTTQLRPTFHRIRVFLVRKVTRYATPQLRPTFHKNCLKKRNGSF